MKLEQLKLEVFMCVPIPKWNKDTFNEVDFLPRLNQMFTQRFHSLPTKQNKFIVPNMLRWIKKHRW